MSNDETFWQALRRRDPAFDGQFFYGVITTKVFCRPSCSARLPLRRNVRFYANPNAAQADGLRPCLRCKPLEHASAHARQLLPRVCAYIRQNIDDSSALKLAALSRHFGLSRFHFQRTFKSLAGVTPRQYAEGLRVESLKEDLRSRSSITGAIYAAGFASSSRVYDAAGSKLGMTPKQYRSGGEKLEISHAVADTPLGRVMIGATDCGICFLEFGDSDRELVARLEEEFPAATLHPMPNPYPEEFTSWMSSLAQFLRHEAPVALHGTAFQTKVWRYLRAIPPGRTETYSAVAEAIGHPKAVRAVASACAANRIAVLIPCHRVIRGDGGLGGYRWGLDRKRALLDAERKLPKG
jgi:AraC family transcriptional regulator of adaptative response/methylated-DNA-[protein]-cysteine methyltransferase